jgi:hypothetical protein
MSTQHALLRRAAILAAAALLGGLASAQSLVSTSANIIATNGDLAPGLGGETFNGSSTFDTGVIADDGTVLFRGRLVGGTTTTTTERAYFYGTTRNNLQLLLRSGSPEPTGTVPGATMNTASGSGLSSSFRISADGDMFFGISMTGGGVTTSNDTGLIVGTPGNFQFLVREGDLAVGTVGATYSSSFSSPSTQSSGLNAQGRAWFTSSLVGGDVSGTTNNLGFYTGTPGNLTLVARKGDVAPNGATLANIYAGFIGQMNASGQIYYDVTYTVGTGTPAVTAFDDRAIWLYTPGVGSVELVRENDPVTDIPGAFYLNGTGSSIPFNFGHPTFTNSGRALCAVYLSGGVVNAGIDELALVAFDATGDELIIRKGDPAPDLQAQSVTLGNFNFSNCLMTNDDIVCFTAALVGPNVTTSDDGAMFTGKKGNMRLVMREGDVGPGTTWTFGSPLGQSTIMNNAGQILFVNSMSNGASSVGTTWLYDPATGLHLFSANGDQLEVQPGVFKTVTTQGGIQFNNGDGRPLSFADNGTISSRVNFSDNTAAVLTVTFAPTAIPETYCTAGTTTNGCVGLISASANPKIDHSNAVTISVNGAEGQKAGLIYYGLTRHNAPWCSSGGSSYLCVKAPTQRTAVQDTAGTNNACDGTMALDWSAFQLGGGTLGSPFLAGNKVDLQAWFRDPSSCKTTSLTNAVELTYQP